MLAKSRLSALISGVLCTYFTVAEAESDLTERTQRRLSAFNHTIPSLEVRKCKLIETSDLSC